MKKTITLTVALAALIFGLAACKDSHDHAEHDDHGDHGDHAGHAHDKQNDGDHEEHEPITPGPNGGRLIRSIAPHLEFVVREDRRVEIHFLGDDLKPVPAGNQVVSLIGGDRSDPFRLAFGKEGASLLSDKPLPAGDDHSAVLQIKASAEATPVIEKFHINLNECPTCKYKEYACICEHAHDH